MSKAEYEVKEDTHPSPHEKCPKCGIEKRLVLNGKVILFGDGPTAEIGVYCTVCETHSKAYFVYNDVFTEVMRARETNG